MKRGMSGIVTSILILVIGIMAVLLIWFIVRSILDNSGEGLDVSKITVMLDVLPQNTGIDKTNNLVYVNVKRKPGIGDMTGVKFVFEAKTSSGSVYSRVIEKTAADGANLPELGQKRFQFNLVDLGMTETQLENELEKVSVSPVIVIEEKEYTLNPQDTFKLQSVSVTTPVVPGEETSILFPDGDVDIQTLGCDIDGYCTYTCILDIDGDGCGGDLDGAYNIFNMENFNMNGKSAKSIEIFADIGVYDGNPGDLDLVFSTNLDDFAEEQNIGAMEVEQYSVIFSNEDGWIQAELDNLQIKMMLVNFGGTEIYVNKIYAEVTYS